MILARGPDSASADEPGIDIRAPLLRVDPQATPPRSASFGGGEQPRCRPRVQSLSLGIAPFRLGMAKPTILQARDRAEVMVALHARNRVTSAGSLERPVTGVRESARNVRKVMSADRVLGREL